MFPRESQVINGTSLGLSSGKWFRETKQLNNVTTSDGHLEVWFHGLITRTQAEELLKGKVVGSFLMRVSQTRFGYSLSFKGTSRCYHIAIEQKGNLFVAIGDNRASFRTLRDLVIFYKRHPVVAEGYVLTEAVGQDDDGCDYMDLIEQNQNLHGFHPVPSPFQMLPRHPISQAPTNRVSELPTDSARTPPRQPARAPVPQQRTRVPTPPQPVRRDLRQLHQVPSPPSSLSSSSTHSSTSVEVRDTVTMDTIIRAPTPTLPKRWEEPEHKPVGRADIIKWFRQTQMTPLMKKQGGFYSWFYGLVGKSKAELMLQDKDAGCFFVRVCEDQCMLCLSMKGSNRKVKHFDIDCLPNKKYQVVGEERDFKSMNNLIQYYKMYPISAFGDKLKEVGCREGHVIDFKELLEGDDS